MRKVLVGVGVLAMAACGSGALERMAADGGELLSDAGQAMRDAGEWLADAGARDSGRAQARDGGGSGLRFETHEVSCSNGRADQAIDMTGVQAVIVAMCGGNVDGLDCEPGGAGWSSDRIVATCPAGRTTARFVLLR